MRKVYLSSASSKYQREKEDEKGRIHYDGPFLIGSHTLCGATDWVGCEWVETTKRVNCRGCIATRDHVMNR
jgi:hypothetical protein